MKEQEPELAETPDAPHSAADHASPNHAKRHFSLVWLVPIVAGLVVIYLGYSAISKRGPEITIRFKTAEGLVIQQTEIKYKSVPLGTVDDVELDSDHKGVLVKVRMQRSGKFMLTDHARFWVVRPRLSPANISGLETLVSGAYVAVDPGEPGGKSERFFQGLDDPPGVTSDEPGHTFAVKASRIGSLSEGAPVYFRDVAVGSLLSYALPQDSGPVSMKLFIRAPYDKLVHTDTVFWNASGISVAMGAEGLHVELESIQTLLSGGIAFETPHNGEASEPATDQSTFQLFADKAKAEASSFRKETPCVTYFQTSVQGLERGSTVQMFGVQVGAVQDVKLVFDQTSQRFTARVAFDIQPERMLKPADYQTVSAPELRSFVNDGLRVVLDSSSLLTGQKVLSLQYVPNATHAAVTAEGDALVLPSQSGGLDGITVAMADIAAKLDRIPFDDIGITLNETIHSLRDTMGGADLKHSLSALSATMTDVNHLVHEADTDLTPALRRLPKIAGELQGAVEGARAALGDSGYGANSDVQRGLARMIDQVSETVRTVRLLADFLDHHPEALLRGRTAHTGER